MELALIILIYASILPLLLIALAIIGYIGTKTRLVKAEAEHREQLNRS